VACIGPWVRQNIATSLPVTTTTTYVAKAVNAAFANFAVAPGPGSVVGVSVAASGTFSASAPRVAVRVNGTSRLAFSMSTGVTRDGTMVADPTLHTYAADSTFSVTVSSAANLAPTTRDLSVWVWTT
jgi:hypothetical protein